MTDVVNSRRVVYEINNSNKKSCSRKNHSHVSARDNSSIDPLDAMKIPMELRPIIDAITIYGKQTNATSGLLFLSLMKNVIERLNYVIDINRDPEVDTHVKTIVCELKQEIIEIKSKFSTAYDIE